MSHTIELKKVSKYYAGEDTVSMGFSRVDLELDMGEFVVITGESGSGKSTLLNVISGLDTYDEGEMFVCNEDTTAYSTEDYERYRKTYIGNIFQDFNLVNSYTVYQNIELVMLLSGKKKAECRDRVNELIHLVGLDEYTKTKASKLSGGQKQRVAIARALAKDAPVIVADEPTGNLDSESAESVMKTLSEVSADRLVVIVTHNYEQAEPYATRKLTMHDGKIIEDKVLRNVTAKEQAGEEREVAEDEDGFGRSNNMGFCSELRLGTRNTFNLASKFILLFIVYLFVSTAVLGQYASTRNSQHESDLLGYSSFFVNTDADRVIVTKKDNTSFTDADIAKLSAVENVKKIFRNDIAIDKGASASIGNVYVEGPVYPINDIKASDLTYGRMPENEYEVVIRTDVNSDAYVNIANQGETLIGKKATLHDMEGNDEGMLDKKIRIAGIIMDDYVDDSNSISFYGYSTFYVSDKVSDEITSSLLASACRNELTYGGNRVDGGQGRQIYASDAVQPGQAYIFESQSYYYPNGKALGKDLNIKVSNRFFESKVKLKVEKVVTEKNCTDLLGIKKDDYDNCSYYTYISKEDFRKLFDKGNFQVSVFLDNELKSEETMQSINGLGYETLSIKDTLSDITGGFNFVLDLLTYGRLIIEFIILLFIAYAVIKLIMRSRNTFYSTMRILGATRKNTDSVLKIELFIMMVIAYAVDMAVVLLVKLDVINVPKLTELLLFLEVGDYVILAAVLLLMSYLIANRYSRKLFSDSAMKSFRGEVQ